MSIRSKIMKAKFRKFSRYYRKHIWVEYLSIFSIHVLISIIINSMRSDSTEISDLLFSSVWFAVIFTPIIRFNRPTQEGLGLYDRVDHVRHYQVGQRPQLKAFLETQGYTIDHNDGAVSYFKSEQDNIFSTRKTFLHETAHWIALVAPPEILDQVPDTIISIYPKKQIQS